eukprot:TRINITY_DN3974_c0_g1_i2.p1 TRINITY_DN3974_c0_g1~~TRINITY_DN3974_c0_g1_i2.p1  ORF type:complete len:510 (+),score=199.36 TRINITY_DN3974_c0_g1_i2:229-1758(+)
MGTEAMDLLKPDVSPERLKAHSAAPPPQQQEEEDDLEALRLAALRSMKPKKPQGYQLQPHPRRTNLLSIVVDESPPVKPQGCLDVSRGPSRESRREDRCEDRRESSAAKTDKFSRYQDTERSSSEEEEEEDEEDEVLKLDASAEVDELTQLLDDMEDKVLKEPKKSSGKRPERRKSRSPLPALPQRRRSRSPPLALPQRRGHDSPPSKRRRSPVFSSRRDSPSKRAFSRESPPYASSKNGKSRSLPPSSSTTARPSSRSIEQSASHRRAVRLPTPEREKRLARSKKFQTPLNLDDPGKKVISLRVVREEEDASPPPPPPSSLKMPSTNVEDAISLSVEDTLDMFEEEEQSGRSLKRSRGSLSANASPDSRKPGGILDLRVQLHKKRQQKMSSKSLSSVSSTYIEEQSIMEEDDDEDSLGHNAGLESSSGGEEEDKSYGGVSSKKKPRRVLIREISPPEEENRKKSNRPSILSRLGDPVKAADTLKPRRSPDIAAARKSPKKKKEKKRKT